LRALSVVAISLVVPRSQAYVKPMTVCDTQQPASKSPAIGLMHALGP
jgi:hypothetical protein